MRIIAGLYKGRDLLPPPGESSTRPITGSVKKSLFAMLGEDLSGQRVLDLFCGTGTLGIEALSRGAEHCCFAERDPAVIARLMRNLQDCRATAQAVIWRGDVESRLAQWLRELTAPVDVAFVDPPYALARQWWPCTTGVSPVEADRTGRTPVLPIDAIFAPLAEKLAPDGIVVLRTDDEAQPPPSLGLLGEVRTRTYGNMVLRLLKKAT
jgi:16S rRNA (guanine(966)-N(2))-methyltransferase RsmD